MTLYALFLFLALTAILFRGANHFSNFGKGALEKHFSEIILKSGPWPRRRCRLKCCFFFFVFFLFCFVFVFFFFFLYFLALAAILFCGAEPF